MVRRWREKRVSEMTSAPPKPRTGNRARIIEATVSLMNEQGGAVGTSQIAAHLGISPGNLYYHFRNREEILRELFDALSRDLDAVLHTRREEAITAERLAACYIGGTRVLWRYRFFFASAMEFIVRDEGLSQKYQALSTRSKGFMRLIIQGAVKAAPGQCRLTARECAHLAETMWVLWVSWPRYSELSLPGQAIAEADIGRGLEQISLLLSPYLDAAFFRKTTQRLRRFVADLGR